MGEVLDALAGWLRQQGIDVDAKLNADDSRQAVVDALRYLTNNRSRMNYPAYSCAGLPVTSALMESMVKEELNQPNIDVQRGIDQSQ